MDKRNNLQLSIIIMRLQFHKKYSALSGTKDSLPC